MTTITVTLAGKPVTIADIAPYRRELEQTRNRLKVLYAGFDPAGPERLLAREEEIRTLYNGGEELRVAVETWEAADAGCANILTAWELVRQLTGGAASPPIARFISTIVGTSSASRTAVASFCPR